MESNASHSCRVGLPQTSAYTLINYEALYGCLFAVRLCCSAAGQLLFAPVSYKHHEHEQEKDDGPTIGPRRRQRITLSTSR